jgi:hypothetical protein
MIKRRGNDNPDDTGVLHRHPLEGPDSNWGRALVGEVKSIREGTADMHKQNLGIIQAVRSEVQKLDDKVTLHISNDETELAAIRKTVALQPTTEQMKGLLNAWTAWRGAALVGKWGAASLVLLAGVAVSLAAIAGVVLWVMGKAPFPAIHIGG